MYVIRQKSQQRQVTRWPCASMRRQRAMYATEWHGTTGQPYEALSGSGFPCDIGVYTPYTDGHTIRYLWYEDMGPHSTHPLASQISTAADVLTEFR